MRSHHFLYLAFFITGIATVSTSALVAMAGTPTHADSDIGGLIAAQFGGQLVGSFCVRRNIRFCLILGCLLTSFAATSLAWTHALSIPLLFVFGLGLGLCMAATNTLTGRESPPEFCARRLEILNVFWPLGAAACPWLLAHLPIGRESPLTLCFGTLAVLFLLLAAGTTLRKRLQKWTAPPQKAQDPKLEVAYPVVLAMLALLARRGGVRGRELAADVSTALSAPGVVATASRDSVLGNYYSESTVHSTLAHGSLGPCGAYDRSTRRKCRHRRHQPAAGPMAAGFLHRGGGRRHRTRLPSAAELDSHAGGSGAGLFLCCSRKRPVSMAHRQDRNSDALPARCASGVCCRRAAPLSRDVQSIAPGQKSLRVIVALPHHL